MRRRNRLARGGGLESDLHDAPFDGGCIIVAIDILSADHVEDDVGAAVASRRLGCGDEISVL